MIIEKIEIESFAGIKELSLDFCSGVNLIEGSNESGKSSVAALLAERLGRTLCDADAEIEKLAAEHEAVCFWSVDIDRCPSLRQEAGGVASVPCVKIYSGESEVGQVVGNYPARLRGLLLSVLKERSELWEF